VAEHDNIFVKKTLGPHIAVLEKTAGWSEKKGDTGWCHQQSPFTMYGVILQECETPSTKLKPLVILG